jgi:hypothetical protein
MSNVIIGERALLRLTPESALEAELPSVARIITCGRSGTS